MRIITFIKNLSTRKKLLVLLVAAVLLTLCSYPVFVLGYTWSHVASSELEGGRNGPLDAYRHTLASAVVAYTLNRRVVNLVSSIMEYRGLESNAMDIHNNAIGAEIGATAKSFSDIEPTVRSYILKGTVNTDVPDQITWLPREKWHDGRAW